MTFTMQAAAGYLRVEVRRRGSSAEARDIGQAIVEELQRSGEKRVLIVVRESDPIFRVEQYGLSELLGRVAGVPGFRFALVSDSRELYASHQYVEVLARQRGIDAASFRDEGAALRWLLSE